MSPNEGVSPIWPDPYRPAIKRGERRRESRYDTELKVRYRVTDKGKEAEACGVTVNLSTGGVLVYDAIARIAPGTALELAIYWPVRLGHICPLHLVVRGHVLRCEDGFFALGADHYEFRTYGARSFQADVELPRLRFDC